MKNLIKRVLKGFGVCSLMFVSLWAFADDNLLLDIKGEWIQGGILHGQTKPNTQIEFLGNTVYVNDKGQFILGLGRDAPKQVEVVATKAAATDTGGKQHRYSYTVKQREYKMQRIEGVAQKYVEPSKENLDWIWQDQKDSKKARSLREPRADFKQGFIWPLSGPITGVFGSQRVFNGVPKRPHYGLDIAAPTGTLVIAPAGGKVTLAKNMYYSGWTLFIDHGQGLVSVFLHLSQVLVKQGDTVKQGDSIAEVGATGRVTGPHLDWRMHWLDQRIDVELLLPARQPSK